MGVWLVFRPVKLTLKRELLLWEARHVMLLPFVSLLS